jgi:hypothetical protein
MWEIVHTTSKNERWCDKNGNTMLEKATADQAIAEITRQLESANIQLNTGALTTIGR